MRAILLIFPILLTACATPREACIAEVSKEARVVDRLVAVTRANLDRGFAVVERDRVRTRRATCRARDSDGNVFRYRCDKTDTVTRRIPVAIDLNEERAKLESLLQRQAQNRENLGAGLAQCNALYPAES